MEQQHSIVTCDTGVPYWHLIMTVLSGKAEPASLLHPIRKDLAKSDFIHSLSKWKEKYQRFVNIMSTIILSHEHKLSFWVWKLSDIKCHLRHKAFYYSDLKRPHLLINARFEVVPDALQFKSCSEFVTVYSLYNSPESCISNAWVSECLCMFWGRVTAERCGGGAWCLTTWFVWIFKATMIDTSKREVHHSIQVLRLENHSIFISKISI